MNYICQVCFKGFKDIPAKKRKYCSKKCVGLGQRNRITIKCYFCNKQLDRIESDIKRYSRVFCDKKCAHNWEKKHKMIYPQLRDRQWCLNQYKTKSLRQIAEAIGCGETTVFKYFKQHGISLDRNKWLIGVPKSEAHKKKLSEWRKTSGISKGNNNNNWKGGITKLCVSIRASKRYREWRSNVYNNLPKQCVFCEATERLEVDHIKKFKYIILDNDISTLEDAFNCNELWDVKNGRILCRSCNIGREK